MKQSLVLGITCFLGALAVALGAFGAHALQDMLTPERLETWNTAVTYQMWHVFALLVSVLLSSTFSVSLRGVYYLFISGIIIFSGSLYALCLTGISILGAITPIGGLCFIAGWLFLGWSLVNSQKNSEL
ncbi:MAG: DUF423 domain-containing protein [Balneola sp.]